MSRSEIIEVLRAQGLAPLPTGSNGGSKWYFYSQAKEVHFEVPVDATEAEVKEIANGLIRNS